MSFALGDPAGSRKVAANPAEVNLQELGTGRPTVVSADYGYELWAQSYDHEPNPVLTLEERLLTPVLPGLKGGRVLDVACGTGRWLSRLIRLGASSGIGIDLSGSMLAAAGRNPHLRGRLVRADCLALPLPKMAADMVVCSFAIGHLPDIETLAAELARVARPHAPIFVSDVHPEACRRGFLRTRFRSNGRPVEITSFSRPMERILEAFAAQGLAVAELIEGRLGDAERPVFERAGRLEHFHELKGLPAIFIVRFR